MWHIKGRFETGDIVAHKRLAFDGGGATCDPCGSRIVTWTRVGWTEGTAYDIII